jgi:hypothetical protein
MTVTIYQAIQCHLPEHHVFRRILHPASAQKCVAMPIYHATRCQNLGDHNMNIYLISYEFLERKGTEATIQEKGVGDGKLIVQETSTVFIQL